MSVTGTVVMQGNKRGDASRKHHLHLPIIAPKDDHSSSASSSRSGQPGSTGSSVPPRARLPPRSRTGCWTCRIRKVKCDEGRPVCGQCTRLGHVCDYSARLTFREDTSRVTERMAADVILSGSPVWDRKCNRRNSDAATDLRLAQSQSASETSPGSTADNLGPFATLTSDEERELKAEHASPGTYNVVVNPDSFQHLPEYNDDSDAKVQPDRKSVV